MLRSARLKLCFTNNWQAATNWVEAGCRNPHCFSETTRRQYGVVPDCRRWQIAVTWWLHYNEQVMNMGELRLCLLVRPFPKLRCL